MRKWENYNQMKTECLLTASDAGGVAPCCKHVAFNIRAPTSLRVYLLNFAKIFSWYLLSFAAPHFSICTLVGVCFSNFLVVFIILVTVFDWAYKYREELKKLQQLLEIAANNLIMLPPICNAQCRPLVS